MGSFPKMENLISLVVIEILSFKILLLYIIGYSYLKWFCTFKKYFRQQDEKIWWRRDLQWPKFGVQQDIHTCSTISAGVVTGSFILHQRTNLRLPNPADCLGYRRPVHLYIHRKPDLPVPDARCLGGQEADQTGALHAVVVYSKESHPCVGSSPHVFRILCLSDDPVSRGGLRQRQCCRSDASHLLCQKRIPVLYSSVWSYGTLCRYCCHILCHLYFSC